MEDCVSRRCLHLAIEVEFVCYEVGNHHLLISFISPPIYLFIHLSISFSVTLLPIINYYYHHLLLFIIDTDLSLSMMFTS